MHLHHRGRERRTSALSGGVNFAGEDDNRRETAENGESAAARAIRSRRDTDAAAATFPALASPARSGYNQRIATRKTG